MRSLRYPVQVSIRFWSLSLARCVVMDMIDARPIVTVFLSLIRTIIPLLLVIFTVIPFLLCTVVVSFIPCSLSHAVDERAGLVATACIGTDHIDGVHAILSLDKFEHRVHAAQCLVPPLVGVRAVRVNVLHCVFSLGIGISTRGRWYWRPVGAALCRMWPQTSRSSKPSEAVCSTPL
jgi:hypothetical protein